MNYWHDDAGALHEAYSAQVFVGGRPLGSFSYDSGRADLGFPRHGLSFFCGFCGQIWASVVAKDPRGYCKFDVVTTSCERHYDQWNLAGSLLDASFLGLLLDDLPREVVEREFKLRINQLVKEIEDEIDYSETPSDH